MKRYVVIENTPGYMPDDDDPATFDDVPEAREYLRSEVARFCEFIEEGDGDPLVTWGADTPEDSYYALVTDETREHDLGRVFSIELMQEGDA